MNDMDGVLNVVFQFVENQRFSDRWVGVFARELPPTLPFAIPALGGEDFSVTDYNCCYYLDGWHGWVLLSMITAQRFIGKYKSVCLAMIV